VVSKNGAVLLNIILKAKREIPKPVKERLLKMWASLKINGKAIYGTRPFTTYSEGKAQVVEEHLSKKQKCR